MIGLAAMADGDAAVRAPGGRQASAGFRAAADGDGPVWEGEPDRHDQGDPQGAVGTVRGRDAGFLIGEERGEAGQRRAGALAVQAHRDGVDATADALRRGCSRRMSGGRSGRAGHRVRRGRSWAGGGALGDDGDAGGGTDGLPMAVSGTLKCPRTPLSGTAWVACANSVSSSIRL